MADMQMQPHALSWGRAPNGGFFINVDVFVRSPNGNVRVPLMGFGLTKDEENELLAALTGLQIATAIPPTNGRH